MSALPHGVCRVCSGVFTVKKDGTLRHHAGRWDGMSRFRGVCAGAGQPPVVAPGTNRNPS